MKGGDGVSGKCNHKDGENTIKGKEVAPISKDDFLQEYPIYEKPTFNVDIGANSCNICN